MHTSDIAGIAEENRRAPAALDDRLDAAIARVMDDGRRLNCVVAVTDASARIERQQLSSGPPERLLYGVPLAHKDMFDRAGQTSQWGSPRLVDHHATATAPVMERLRRAGALNVARLHMAELAMGLTGHNHHLGRCLNPHGPERISGGSSSGSAVAVGQGIVAASLGSDTGGSIRVPAGICGVVGLKPTWGRVNAAGAMPLAPSLDCIGVIAGTVADCARVFDVIADGACGAPGTTEYGLAEDGGPMVVRWPQRYFQDDVDESVAKALDQWRRDMEATGWRFCDGALPDAAALAHYNGIVLGREAADTHAEALLRHPDRIGEQVRRRLEAGAAIDPAEYRSVLAARAVHRQHFLDAAFDCADILATPLLRVATPTGQEAEADHPDRITRVLGEIGHNVRPFSYLGLPALVVPIGLDGNGMPVAVQLVGRPGSEGELLRAGLVIERQVQFRKCSQSAASYL